MTQRGMFGIAGDPSTDIVTVQGTGTGGAIPTTDAAGTSTYALASQVSVTGTIGDLLVVGIYKVVIFRALTANTQSIFWGPAGVGLTTGMELKPGEEQILDGASAPVNLIRALSTSGTQTVIVMTAT